MRDCIHKGEREKFYSCERITNPNNKQKLTNQNKLSLISQIKDTFFWCKKNVKKITEAQSLKESERIYRDKKEK